MKFHDRLAPWTALLVGAGLIVLAACDGGDTAPATPTTEATTTTEAAPTTAAVASPTRPSDLTITTPRDFSEAIFGREPVEKPGDAAPPTALLVELQTGASEGFDRLVFQFEGGSPGYRVEYVSPPITACGSGLPVEIAGDAFLQVRLSPAAAHDDTGLPTIDMPELPPDLGAIVDVRQICDFEGEVTWTMGLSEETDFRVFDLVSGLLVVDVLHP